jgi:hypothetical protein
VVKTFASIPFFEFAQVKTCTKVVAITGDHSSVSFFGKVLEDVSQRGDQPVVQSVALGRTRQPHDGDAALHL